MFAEFSRVSSKNLKKEFYEALDRFIPRLIGLFKSKKGAVGQAFDRLLCTQVSVVQVVLYVWLSIVSEQ